MKISYEPPDGWRFPTLEEIAAPEKGAIRIGPFGSALKKHEYSDSGVRVLGIEDVFPNELVSTKRKYIPELKFRELSQYTVKSGDLLVTNMGTVGRTCVVPETLERSIISSHLIKISLNPREAWPPYVSWMLNFCPLVVAQVKAKCQGAIMAGFNSSLLKQLHIPLPPLVEQRRIAEVLDQAEALRAKRRAALAQFDTLTQSIFLNLFGDPATDPNGWGTKPLRELVTEFRYGTSNKSDTFGQPALRIPNVVGGAIDISDLKLVPVDPAEFDRLKLIKGDVLFVRTNGNPDFVGRCAVFDDFVAANSGFSSNEFVFASYLIRARLKVGQITPIFLREFMLGTEGRRQLRARCKTSAGQFNINTENLGAISIPLPPHSLQEDFARRLGAVDRLRVGQRDSLAELDALFAVLQYHAFRGEL